MYCEMSWIGKAAAGENLLAYFFDEKHRDHRHKTIGPEIKFRIPTDQTSLEFLLKHVAECDASNCQIRPGRKIKRKLAHTIVRLPDDSRLMEWEKIWTQNEIMIRMEWQGGVSVSHTDDHNGATDFHFLTPYRKGRSNPIAKLRAVCDEVHDELNRMRREQGMSHIETMPEARHRLKKQRGIKPLAVQLSTVDGLSAANLKSAVEGLGHTVSRYNEERGSISIVHAGKKKGHRYGIEALLTEALALRSLKALRLPTDGASAPEMDLSYPKTFS
jgi:hypothetical protein